MARLILAVDTLLLYPCTGRENLAINLPGPGKRLDDAYTCGVSTGLTL